LLGVERSSRAEQPKPSGRISGLVSMAKSGQGEAFGLLYEEYVERVYRYVYVRTGRVEEAEDLTQEVFLRALNSIDAYRDHGKPFSAWLMRIARNEVASFQRRSGRRPQTELTEEIEDRHNGDIVETTERVMALEDLRVAVGQLPEAQRDVITLRFAAGLSVADTAKALGKRENNVKVLQHKGMQKLQVLMAPKYPELSQRQA